jgi:hypothetical protein
MIFNRIRKIYGTAAALGLTACLLFGCTRADVATSSGNAASSGQAAAQGTATSTVSDGSLAGAGSGTGSSTGSNTPSSSGSAVSSADPADSGKSQQAAPTAQNVTGTTTQTASQTPAASQSAAPAPESTAPAQGNTAPAAPEAAQEMEDCENYDIGEEYVEESVSGEFEKSDGTESVVLSLMNDNEISFQFRESGIGAYAQASGSTAVYTGDDGYSILFDVAGDTLAVSISGEDGDQSPMNGIYYRILDGGDDADGEQDADLQDAGLEDAEDLDDSVYADAQ